MKQIKMITLFLCLFILGVVNVSAESFTLQLASPDHKSNIYFKRDGVNMPYQATLTQMHNSSRFYYTYCMDHGRNISEGASYTRHTLRSMKDSIYSNRSNMAKNENKVIAVMNNIFPYITLAEMNKRVNAHYGYSTGNSKYINLTERKAIAAAQARLWQLSGVTGNYTVDMSRSKSITEKDATDIEKTIDWLKTLKDFELDEPRISIVSSSYKYDSSKAKYVATVNYKVTVKQTDGAKVTHKISNNANSQVDTYNRSSGNYTYKAEFDSAVDDVTITIKVANKMSNFREVRVYENNTWQDLIGSTSTEEGDSASTFVRLTGNNTATYRVYKKDTAGRIVQGVKFRLAGYGKNLVCTVDHTGFCDFPSLEPGTYTLTEESVPQGYIKLISTKSVVIKDSDVGHLVEDNVVNDVTKVQISKQDITTGKELPGAHLQIKNSAGNILYSWTSTNTPYYIDRLPFGKYTLVETIAPKGYKKLKTETTFEITNGNLVKIIVSNAPTKIKISKKDLTTGKELPGAHLQIKNSAGDIVAEWVSTSEPHYIEGLPLGKYTLTETIAPDGYKKSEKEYPFEITNDNEVDITVYNEYIVVDTKEEEIKVPKTDSYAKNIIYIVGGAIMVAGTLMGVHALKSKKA